MAEENKPDFDFTSIHTDNFPKILNALNISLAVTSYQAGVLFFLRSDGQQIESRYVSFPRPMGLYADKSRLTLGTFAQVLEFKRSDHLLQRVHDGEMDTTATWPGRCWKKSGKPPKPSERPGRKRSTKSRAPTPCISHGLL